jgi:cytochrome c biogenesis protein CcmG, thiol:disulfide interchange protein DsbE
MIYRVIAIIAIIAATVFYSFHKKDVFQSQLATDTEIGSVLKKLPQAVFEGLDGKPVDLDAVYLESQTSLMVVHYWGTWCAPCEAELPELMNFMRRFEGRQDVKFVLVAVNDDLVKVKKHIAATAAPKANILWLLDNKSIHRDVYGTTRVPETYVFSSNKQTLRKYLGPQEWNKTMFYEAFEEFLGMSQI